MRSQVVAKSISNRVLTGVALHIQSAALRVYISRVLRYISRVLRYTSRVLRYLQKVGKLGVPIDHQAVHFVLKLMLLDLLEGDVIFGEAGLALPVLQHDEADLRAHQTRLMIRKSRLTTCLPSSRQRRRP